IANDDSFEVDGTSLSPQGYNVVRNDVEGTNGVLTLDSVTQPDHGTVSLAGDGKSVLYTPDGIWFNMESFTYTVSNPLGQTRTANVTVHVEPEVDDNLVEFAVSFQDDAGNPLAGNTVEVGERFQVLVTVEDLRLAPEGVFSAYMDLLYEREYVSVVSASAVTCANTLSGVDFGICFDGEYNSLIHGSADKPGLIDEVGALRPIISAPGDVGAVELFVITFQAHSVGVADFKTDPTDELPTFETTVYGLLSAVDPPDITYDFGQVTITSSGSGEGEALDVNGDGAVTPVDALSVINDLNRYGARAVGFGAEGETAITESRLDVNGDNFISPADALLLINHLNDKAQSGEGEGGEGEGEAPVMGPLPENSTSRSSLESTLEEQQADLLAEAVLSTVDPARNLANHVQDSSDRDRDQLTSSEDAGNQSDNWLDDLAADVWQAWIS
ncbi:MAG: dockerin type I domain-containing protein, partial [Pirellulaceae bacterium]